jgi:hypothetical protein
MAHNCSFSKILGRLLVAFTSKDRYQFAETLRAERPDAPAMLFDINVLGRHCSRKKRVYAIFGLFSGGNCAIIAAAKAAFITKLSPCASL